MSAQTENDRYKDLRLLSALLVEAIHVRQTQGQVTTLRDLHGLLDVSQPIALQAARELERDGVAKIEPNLSDAFASVVTISRTTVSQMNLARQSRKTGCE